MKTLDPKRAVQMAAVPPYYLYLALAGGLSLLLFAIFRYEYRLPLVITIFVIPPITLAGFVVPWLAQRYFRVDPLWAMAGEATVLIVLLLAYEASEGVE